MEWKTTHIQGLKGKVTWSENSNWIKNLPQYLRTASTTMATIHPADSTEQIFIYVIVPLGIFYYIYSKKQERGKMLMSAYSILHYRYCSTYSDAESGATLWNSYGSWWFECCLPSGTNTFPLGIRTHFRKEKVSHRFLSCHHVKWWTQTVTDEIMFMWQ